MNWTTAAVADTIKPPEPRAEGADPFLLFYCLALLDDPSLEDEFRHVFALYSPSALRVARRHLDEHLAQDAVNDAFIRLATSFSTFFEVPPAQRKSYFLTIVKHCAIDLLRREGRYTGLDEDESLPGGLDPARATQVSAGYDALVSAILTMPPTYRTELEYRLIREWSPAVTAAALGLSVALVNSRFSYGRKLLRQKLIEEGIYP